MKTHWRPRSLPPLALYGVKRELRDYVIGFIVAAVVLAIAYICFGV